VRRNRSPAAETTLRILFCIDSLATGGKERQAAELIKGLTRTPGFECLVVCLDASDFFLAELAAAGVKVEFVLRRMRWDPTVFPRLHRIASRYQPDVVHTNGLVSTFYALPVSNRLGAPLVNGSIRNAFSEGGIRWHLEKWFLNAADYRVANSCEGLRSRGFERATENVVIYNGFDFSRLERGVAGELPRAVAAAKTKVVGMVASFNKYKDYFTFVRTAQIISGRRKDVLFVTVGDGEKLEEHKKLADGLETVQFLGKRRDVEQVIRTFDIGVLSTFSEGLSNSIMEYMALAKPVVASDSGGTKELVVDGETGFLVPPRDPSALAGKIEFLLDHPDAAKRMGEAGYTRLRGEFSVEKMIAETVKLYRVAVDRRNGRASTELPEKARV
jgi:glycosyltransferase involved in cell wall biosynthesis